MLRYDSAIVPKTVIPVEHHVAVYNDTIIVLKMVISVEHHVAVYVYDDTIIVPKMVISVEHHIAECTMIPLLCSKWLYQ